MEKKVLYNIIQKNYEGFYSWWVIKNGEEVQTFARKSQCEKWIERDTKLKGGAKRLPEVYKPDSIEEGLSCYQAYNSGRICPGDSISRCSSKTE